MSSEEVDIKRQLEKIFIYSTWADCIDSHSDRKGIVVVLFWIPSRILRRFLDLFMAMTKQLSKVSLKRASFSVYTKYY